MHHCSCGSVGPSCTPRQIDAIGGGPHSAHQGYSRVEESAPGGEVIVTGSLQVESARWVGGVVRVALGVEPLHADYDCHNEDYNNCGCEHYYD